jgi:hypothetical protein
MGMLLAYLHTGMVGEEIEIDLGWEPSYPPISLSGVVLYAIEGGLGIRFKGISSDQQVQLRTYVQTHGGPV